MFVGIGVGIGRQRFNSLTNAYVSRVLADGGTLESLVCVDAATALQRQASLLLIPSGYKSGVVYSQLPENGNGDLTFTRNSTATRVNSSGLIESVAANVPRLDYSQGSCPSLLLEPQRTNSIRNSTMQGAATGSPGTLPTNWTTGSAGLTRTVVDTGTESGLPYIDLRFNGTATSNSIDISFDVITEIAASNGQVWTASTWLKQVSNPNPFNSINYLIFEQTSAGGFVTAGSLTVSVTSSLERFAFTRTLNGGATVGTVRSLFRINLTIGQTYDFTIRIAAPQMELGAYATTYIPTTSATATRLADTFTRNDIYTNGLISASGGTWFVELKNNVAYNSSNGAIQLGLGNNTVGASADNLWIAPSATGRMRIWKQLAGTITSLHTTSTDNIKITIKWNSTTADVFVNGSKVVSATAFTPTALGTLRMIQIDQPYFMQAMALYPTPLSDSDCISLTS